MKPSEQKPKRRNKLYEDVPGGINYRDLRGLLFWAAIGVAKSENGSYPEVCESPDDEGVIRSYAEHIKFPLPVAPRFGEMKRNVQRLERLKKKFIVKEKP